MCDVQEIDRLCKTQPTGENNYNRRRTREDGTVDRAPQTPDPRRGERHRATQLSAHPGKVSQACAPPSEAVLFQQL